MNEHRGFDQGRRDDNGHARDERDRDLEQQMRRERTMQGGMGRGWNEPHERAGYGGDDRYGGTMRRDTSDERGYEREHDMRSHNFGFGGTDQGFRGGGYGGYGRGNEMNRGNYGNYGHERGPWERDRYGMSGNYGNERGPSHWADDRYQQDRGNSWGNEVNRGNYGYERGSGMGGSHFGSEHHGGRDIGGGGGTWNQSRGMGGNVGGHDMGWEARNYGQQQGQGTPPRQGKAPRSYQRSDERIKEDICDRLMHGWVDASNVEVQVRTGEVTLSGTVEDRQSKRAVEDIAEQIMGVREVQNQIRVAAHDQRAEAHTQSTTGTTTSSKKPTA